MLFPPHEPERSRTAVNAALAGHESELLYHEMKHLGGWILRHKEYNNERVFFFNTCARVTEQLDRLDMLSDKETLHNITEDGQDTWVAAVRSNGNGKLPKRRVRLIVNSSMDISQPDGSLIPGRDLQDIVIDPIRQKIGLHRSYLPADPALFKQLSNNKTPPLIDIAKYYDGQGLDVYADPAYILPFPVDPSNRPLHQMYEVNRQLLELVDLLSKLGVGTEQQSPVWYKHRDA